MTILGTAIIAARQARPARPRRRAEEHGFQRTLYEFLEIALPPDAILTSIDHAGDNSPATRANRAGRGVLTGIPDTLVIWQPDRSIRLHRNVWFECKRKKGGKLSVEQGIWRDTVLAAGHFWCAPITLEDAIQTLIEAEVPLRARPTV